MLNWSENLAVGVKNIDSQHKEIFNRLNRLFDACSNNKAKQEVQHLVEFLEFYVSEHFKDEEELQRTSSYPEYSAHINEHKKFMLDLESLKSKIETEQDKNHLLELTELLTQWLVEHIGKVDKQFSLYYKNFAKK